MRKTTPPGSAPFAASPALQHGTAGHSPGRGAAPSKGTARPCHVGGEGTPAAASGFVIRCSAADASCRHLLGRYLGRIAGPELMPVTRRQVATVYESATVAKSIATRHTNRRGGRATFQAIPIAGTEA